MNNNNLDLSISLQLWSSYARAIECLGWCVCSMLCDFKIQIQPSQNRCRSALNSRPASLCIQLFDCCRCPAPFVNHYSRTRSTLDVEISQEFRSELGQNRHIGTFRNSFRVDGFKLTINYYQARLTNDDVIRFRNVFLENRSIPHPLGKLWWQR